MSYENAQLWKTTFEGSAYPDHAKALLKLKQAYAAFWENAVYLSRDIQKTLPTLTLHDETHFTALWDMAGLILGDAHDLNPLEVFVLGGAILIHDAANGAAAFDGGLDEIKSRAEWSDAVAAVQKRRPDEDHNEPLSAEEEEIALLNALRAIHATRAEEICDFKVNVDGRTSHLIPDDNIRDHLGELIGKVAASHHWNVEDLPRRLRESFSPPADFPSGWTVRPVLLAAIMRCADAIQLDQRRTPDFLFGLLKLDGLSEAHWQAQNFLAQPCIDPKDAQSIRFTSTKSFTADKAQAWWIAHDSIRMANGELQAVDSLLRDLGLPQLRINRITGAEDPLRLAEHIQTKGWKPVDAEVKISRVDHIVEMFGGEQLYGQRLRVPIRELIQNAADAVRMRRALEEQDGNSYEGRITLRLTSETKDGVEGYRLDVDDDGLGMSEDVLTGPLIDFGSGYMNSTIINRERPGLAGLKPLRTGKYGIGFFSVFMLGDDVTITSRPYDEGVQSAKSLSFKDGLSNRPLLIDPNRKDAAPSISTRVSVFIERDNFEDLVLNSPKKEEYKSETLDHDFSTVVAALAPMLDVDIWVSEGSNKEFKVHRKDWYSENRSKWLLDLYPEHKFSPELNYLENVGRIIEYLDYVDPDNKSYGLAAISPFLEHGTKAVGMLSDSFSTFSRRPDGFIGAIDYLPEGPKRNPNSARANTLNMWASRQAQKFASGSNFSQEELILVAMRVAMFGGDATPIASAYLNYNIVSVNAIVDKIMEDGRIIAPLSYYDFKRETPVINQVALIRNYSSMMLPSEHIDLAHTIIQFKYTRWDYKYYKALSSHSAMTAPRFMDILSDALGKKGKLLRTNITEVNFGIYTGPSSEMDGVETGQDVIGPGAELTITDLP